MSNAGEPLSLLGNIHTPQSYQCISLSHYIYIDHVIAEVNLLHVLHLITLSFTIAFLSKVT